MPQDLRLLVGSDAAGFDLKDAILADLQQDSHVASVEDLGVAADDLKGGTYPSVAILSGPLRNRRCRRPPARLARLVTDRRLDVTRTYRVVVGSDDAGSRYRAALAEDLSADPRVSEVLDLGLGGSADGAYPHVAVEAARLIASGGGGPGGGGGGAGGGGGGGGPAVPQTALWWSAARGSVLRSAPIRCPACGR